MSEHRKRVRLIVFSGLLFALALSAAYLRAQTQNAEVIGRITDPQGAVIPRADVKLIEQTRGSTLSTVTAGDGTYHIVGIPSGVYRLEVRADGFKLVVVPDIVLRISVQKRLDLTLEVGAVTTEITVTDTAPAIETQAPTISSVLPKVIMAADKPVMQFSYWYGAAPGMFLQGHAAGGIGVFLYGAGHRDQQQFTLEGTEYNTFLQGTPETSLGEIKLILSNAPAEYSRPVSSTATFRSGTNQYHGLWEWHFESDALRAINTPWYQCAPENYPCRPRPPLWKTALTIGGPIRIPQVYDGRNKSFFNFSYGKTLTSTLPQLFRMNVPSLDMQEGDFSQYTKTIIDPLTGEPFPGNVIPSDRINPVSARYNALAWAPGQQDITYVGSPSSFVQNVDYTRHFQDSAYHYVLRFDQNIGQSDILNFSVNRSIQRGWSQPTGGQIPRSYSSNLSPATLYSLGETHTFSPTVVNELRLGVWRQTSRSLPAYGDRSGTNPPAVKTGRQWLTELGIEGLDSAPDSPGCPSFSVSGWPYGLQSCSVSRGFNTYYQLTDNLFIKQGAHGFKLGWYTRHYALDSESSGPFWGNYNFDGRFTGEAYADFLLGYPGTMSLAVPRSWISRRVTEHAAYLQDDWNITKNLNMNIGVRWGYNGAPHDRNGQFFNADIDYATGNVRIVVPDQKAVDSVNPLWPSNLPVVTAATAGYPSRLIKSTHMLQPRWGFAWRPGGGNRTVIRGGYGMYSSLLAFDRLQTGGPFQLTGTYDNQLVPTETGGVAPRYSFPTPFTALGTAPSVTSAGHTDINYRSSKVHQASVTLEHMFTDRWAGRVSYILNRTTHLPWSRNINMPMLSTIPYTPDRRPYPQWSTLTVVENGFNARYQELQFQISRVLANGVWFQSNYAWRHDRSDMDLCDTVSGLGQCASSAPYAYDRNRDYGPSGNATASFGGTWPTHMWLTHWVWELPMGTGRHFLADLSTRGAGGKLLNAVLGGWSTSGVFVMRSGLPYSVFYSGADPGNINLFWDRADLVPGCDPTAGQDKNGLWFNPSCFTIPQPGTLGNSTRNMFRGPGSWVIMLSPYKEFKLGFLGEGGKFQIGANIYDLTNTPSYALPTNDIRSALAGKITGPPPFGVFAALGGWQTRRAVSIRAKMEF